MDFFNSLLTRFILAASLLLALVVSLSLTYQGSLALQNALSDWHNQTEQLTMELVKINALADKYKQNAPRDYESYNRDLVIFNEQFQQAISTLGQRIEAMDRHAESAAGNPIWWLLNDDAFDTLANTTQPAMSTGWSQFNSRLHELIGDPEEPRLEWAAEYVIESGPTMLADAQMLGSELVQLEASVDNQLSQLNALLLCAVVGYIVAGFVAFLMWVIRPVIKTAKACEAVAAGNYGHAVDIQGSGETRHLQQSFNELSWSAGLMLDLVRDLSRSGNLGRKLEGILNSGQKPLGIRWVGLMQLGQQDAELIDCAPSHVHKAWRHPRVSLHKSFGRRLKATQGDQWLNIDDLSGLALNHHDERFLREMHKHAHTNFITGFGFSASDGQAFLLLFASDGVAFKPHQKELLKNLSGLMASSLLEAIDVPAENQNIAKPEWLATSH